MPTLEELKAKQERGEKLTDEEAEILKKGEKSKDETPEIEELDATKLREMYLAEKRRADNKAEEANRHFKKLDALEKAEKERQDAELSELQKANKQLGELVPEVERLRNENRTLLLRTEFNEQAEGLKLEFASPEARSTALSLLPMDIVGDDMHGMKDALAALQKKHSYLFGKVSPPETDAKQKGRVNVESVNAEALEEKRRQYGGSI